MLSYCVTVCDAHLCPHPRRHVRPPPCCAGRLAYPVAYMGAMGSCHTHQQRLQLLREAGVPELHLTRLRSPVDLDLRAHTIIAHTHQRPNTPLTRSTGLIHRQKTPA
ncbi:XdhC family protein [Streptomyces sp900116325]|uniref:XdhC family protein n=2 Tax=unclassified Streptomyces TaxID=2593676 RepID=UPI0033D0F823